MQMKNIGYVAGVCLALFSGSVIAQPSAAAVYPARPLRIIVPQSPGASTDLTARLVAQRLSEAFKQPVVVDNRPGAGTIIGTELVTRATPGRLYVAGGGGRHHGKPQHLPARPLRYRARPGPDHPTHALRQPAGGAPVVSGQVAAGRAGPRPAPNPVRLIMRRQALAAVHTCRWNC